MMVYEYGKDMILVDAGIMFPDDEMPGIDLVLPDFQYVVKNQDKLRGIFITHGHEDHTGALPYLLKEVNAPVFATKLSLGFIEAKLEEHRLLGKVSLNEVKPGGQTRLGPFFIEFMRVVHSIPDGVAMAIHTPIGTVVHSSDFKFDQTPIVGEPTDYAKLATLGTDRVLALLSDSTNAMVPGYGRPERDVGKNLHRIMSTAKGRVLIATFASHIHRLQQVFDVAQSLGRKVAVVGRSVERNTTIASELGYLKISKGTLIPAQKIDKHPPEKVVIICTGSQGEPMAALSLMAFNDHRLIRIGPKDTVIISAKPVPGNEKAVQKIINELTRRGADLHVGSEAGVHVSGHARQEELKMMMGLVRPRFFIPVHGEPAQLVAHADLARQLGYADKEIILPDNGDVIELTATSIQKKGTVPSGIVFVDGSGVGEVEDMVLRDRQTLAKDGICVVIVTVNLSNGELLGDPEIVMKGFAVEEAIEKVLDEAKNKIIESMERSAKEQVTDIGILQTHVREAVGRHLNQRIRRRPMIIPVIVEV